MLAEFTPEAVAERAGVPADAIRSLGERVAKAKHAVALPPGVALTSRRALATNAAVLVLDAVAGSVGSGVRIPPVADAPASSFRDVVKLIDAMKSGDVKELKEKEATIVDIARDLGYSNDKVFRRAYKRVMGVSPGSYRDMIGDDERNLAQVRRCRTTHGMIVSVSVTLGLLMAGAPQRGISP